MNDDSTNRPVTPDDLAADQPGSARHEHVPSPETLQHLFSQHRSTVALLLQKL